MISCASVSVQASKRYCPVVKATEQITCPDPFDNKTIDADLVIGRLRNDQFHAFTHMMAP